MRTRRDIQRQRIFLQTVHIGITLISMTRTAGRTILPMMDGGLMILCLKPNHEASRDLYDKILEIGKKWVSAPYDVDGWRLDVAADLGHSNEFNHQFWKDFRKAVKAGKSQCDHSGRALRKSGELAAGG